MLDSEFFYRRIVTGIYECYVGLSLATRFVPFSEKWRGNGRVFYEVHFVFELKLKSPL